MDKLNNDSISSKLSDIHVEQKRKVKFSDNQNEVVDEARNLIQTCLHALTDYPEDIVVTTTVATTTIIFEVTVNDSDIGSVLGKKAINISATRRLLHCLGLKHKVQIRMELVQ